MPFPLILMLADEPAAMLARQRAAIADHCVYVPNQTDVTVCGRRNADRFRVPLKPAPPPSERAADDAAAERVAFLHRTSPIQELSPFLVGGGSAGATVGTSFGPGTGSGKTTVSGPRPLAP